VNAREWLIDLEKQFIDTHDGQEPTHLYLSREDEYELARMSRNEWGGNIAEQVQRDGVRAAFPQFDRKPIIWDAEVTRFA